MRDESSKWTIISDVVTLKEITDKQIKVCRADTWFIDERIWSWIYRWRWRDIMEGTIFNLEYLATTKRSKMVENGVRIDSDQRHSEFHPDFLGVLIEDRRYLESDDHYLSRRTDEFIKFWDVLCSERIMLRFNTDDVDKLSTI